MANKLPNSTTHRLDVSGVVIRKSVDGYGQNPGVPSAGANTMPRDEGGRFQSAVYQGGTGDPFARQPSASAADGNAPSGVGPVGPAAQDREASASRGPGFIGNFKDSTPVTRMPIHVRSPMARMIAGGLIRQSVTEFGAGPEGQPIAVERYAPVVQPDSLDLNPYEFAACFDKVNQLTAAFRAMHGRFPIVGGPGDADDEAYRHAVEAVLDTYYGYPSGNFIP